MKDTMRSLQSSPRRLARFERRLVASVLASLPATAMAQASAIYPGSSAITYTPMQRRAPDPALPPPLPAPPILPPAPVLTAEQLDAMVDLFSSAPQEVMRRLWLDPELAPLALEAAQRRKSRGLQGKVMTGIGLTIIGFGVLATASFMIPSDRSDCHIFLNDICQTTPNNTDRTLGGVAIGSIILGLGIAIPGMVEWGRKSALEKQAIRRYRQQDTDRRWLPPHAGTTSLVSPSKAFQIQLLSFRF
jgi:hypothetical protein